MTRRRIKTGSKLRTVCERLGEGGQTKLARLLGWDPSTIRRKLASDEIKLSDEYAIRYVIEVLKPNRSITMPPDALAQFDALVAALERLSQMHDGPEHAAATEALSHAPAIREQLAASVPRLTRAELEVIDREIAVKLKDELMNLQRMGRTPDVADVTDIYWPYLVRLLGKPG